VFKILTQKLTIDKKNLINKYLKTLNSENSELTFTNLFIWRNSYNVRYSVIEDTLVIISKHSDAPYIVYYPIGNGNKLKALDTIIKELSGNNEDFLIRTDNEYDIEELNNAYPEKLSVIEDTDSFDYVYDISDLKELRGKKYHAKRNFINRFENNYSYSYHKMTPDYKNECFDLFKKWYAEKDNDTKGISESFEAVNELLENWENLDITGGCITIDGKMIAFSFGEVLHSENNTVVIHLEHADTSFEGAFPMINKQFLLNEWHDYKYVNREEDMGLEGLRKAKQSYYPCRMVKKYLIKLK